MKEKALYNKLKTFDILEYILGNYFTFEQKEGKQFKTICGSILTILLFISISAYGIMIGKEIWEKTTPVVMTSLEYLPNSIINITDIPILISIHDKKDVPYNQTMDDYFDFEVEYLQITNYVISLLKTYHGKVDCDPEKFNSHKEYIKNTIELSKNANMKLICFNLQSDFFIQNGFAANNASSIIFHIKKCDSNKRKCADDVEEKTSMDFVLSRYINSYVDPKNYENPILYYENTVTQQIGNKFLKFSKFMFNIGTIETDVGWLFNNIKKQDYIYLSEIKSDINVILENNMYDLYFESPQLRNKTVRTYLKLSEILSKIGGLYTGIILFFSYLLQGYTKFKYYQYIYSIYEEKNENNSKSLFNLVSNIPYKDKKDIPNHNRSQHAQNKTLENKSNVVVLKNNIHIYENQSIVNLKNRSDCLYYFISNDDIQISYVRLIMLYICCFKEEIIKKRKIYQKFTSITEDLISFTSYIDLIQYHARIQKNMDNQKDLS